LLRFLETFFQVHFVKVPHEPIEVDDTVEGEEKGTEENKKKGTPCAVEGRACTLALGAFYHEGEFMSDQFEIADGKDDYLVD
jgi:hypothetical protein